MNSDSPSTFLAVIGIIIMLVIGVLLAIAFISDGLDDTCTDKFGNGWTGRMSIYSQDVCVNDKGEVRYP